MKKEEKGKREDITSEAGKPRWYYSSQVSWPPLDGKDSRNQRMQKTFAGDGELTENRTASYWG
jgi:hypothetical protein